MGRVCSSMQRLHLCPCVQSPFQFLPSISPATSESRTLLGLCQTDHLPPWLQYPVPEIQVSAFSHQSPVLHLLFVLQKLVEISSLLMICFYFVIVGFMYFYSLMINLRSSRRERNMGGIRLAILNQKPRTLIFNQVMHSKLLAWPSFKFKPW